VTSGTRQVVPFVDIVAADGGLAQAIAVDASPVSGRKFTSPVLPFDWFPPPGEWTRLIGARMRADNSLYLAGDWGADPTIARLVDSGGTVSGPEWPLGRTTGPFDVDREGTVYSIAADGEAIEVRVPDDESVVTWGDGGTVAADFGRIVDIAATVDGNVLLVDGERGLLELRNGDGELLDSWDGSPSPFSNLTAVWSGSDGALWVADRDGARIRVLDAEEQPGWRMEIFRDRWLTDHFTFAEVLDEPRRNWGASAPAVGLPADGWSARIWRDLDLAAAVA
jgi:hypothetical protein